jgi:hypothetical protein
MFCWTARRPGAVWIPEEARFPAQSWSNSRRQAISNQVGTACCPVWVIRGVSGQLRKHAWLDPRPRLIAKTVKRIVRFMCVSSFSRGGACPKPLRGARHPSSSHPFMRRMFQKTIIETERHTTNSRSALKLSARRGGRCRPRVWHFLVFLFSASLSPAAVVKSGGPHAGCSRRIGHLPIRPRRSSERVTRKPD